jgi:hypothetical protein
MQEQRSETMLNNTIPGVQLLNTEASPIVGLLLLPILMQIPKLGLASSVYPTVDIP